jgi:BMFP domain-containing protein YqiC
MGVVLLEGVAAMQTDNPLLDDLARVASGALGALTGMRAEIEARIRDQLEPVLARMDLVTREEFDAVRAMAAKARGEQDKLLERIAALEARLDGLAAKPARAARRDAASRNAEPAAD